MKCRLNIIFGIMIINIILFIYFVWNNTKPTKFLELKCYETKYEDHLKRVFLVTDLPNLSSVFKEDLYLKVKSLKKSKKSKEYLLFIKERDINLIEKYFWGDKKYYANCTASINNIDFLSSVTFFNDETEVDFYEGEYYFY